MSVNLIEITTFPFSRPSCFHPKTVSLVPWLRRVIFGARTGERTECRQRWCIEELPRPMPRLSLQFVIVLAAFPPDKMSQHITKLKIIVESYGTTWVNNLCILNYRVLISYWSRLLRSYARKTVVRWNHASMYGMPGLTYDRLNQLWRLRD